MAAPVSTVQSVVPIPGHRLNISEKFAAQCAPVIDSDYNTTNTDGLALGMTRASVQYMTKTMIDAIFSTSGLYGDMDYLFKHMIEMKACGIHRNKMYDWITANADRTNFRAALFPGMAISRGGNIVPPFILAKQRSVINDDHWKITACYAAYNSAGVPVTLVNTYKTGGKTYTGGIAIRVESGGNSAGTSFQTPVNEMFFRPMDTLHIFNVKAGVSQHGQWRVIDSAHDTNQTYCYVVLQDINPPAGEPYEPFTGGAFGGSNCIMVRGVNNVNDYESWMYNRPTLDDRKLVPFWRQTFRMARRVDADYLEAYGQLMQSNIAFREFGDLPMAERNKQDEKRQQENFVNDFFYNLPLQFQNLNDWNPIATGVTGLDKILTIDGFVGNATAASIVGGINTGLSGRLAAYRAQFIGVREQLRQCAMVFDLLGNALNLYEWLNLNYQLMRAKSDFFGREVTELNWWTNNQFAALFATAYVNYLAKEYGGTNGISPTMFMKPEEVSKAGFCYRTYKFKYPSGVDINIFTDHYFDDRLDRFQGISQEAAGNLMWCLDIGKPGAGSIYWAQIAENRVSSQTAPLKTLASVDITFASVMKIDSFNTTMTSQEGTAVVECPLANCMVENFSLAAPNTSGTAKTIGGVGSLGTVYDLLE